jgi:hypothetical protein
LFITPFDPLKLFTNADLPRRFNNPINTHGAIQPLSFSGFILPVGDHDDSGVSSSPGVHQSEEVGADHHTVFSATFFPFSSVFV